MCYKKIGIEKRGEIFKMENLIWEIDNENENGGYWVLQYCR